MAIQPVKKTYWHNRLIKNFLIIYLQGLGEVVEVGEGVKHIKKGDKAAYMNTRINSYSEYVVSFIS